MQGNAIGGGLLGGGLLGGGLLGGGLLGGGLLGGGLLGEDPPQVKVSYQNSKRTVGDGPERTGSLGPEGVSIDKVLGRAKICRAFYRLL